MEWETFINKSCDVNSSDSTTGNDSLPSGHCDLMSRFAINTVFAGTICVLGIVGNMVSFLVLQNDKSTVPVAAFLLRWLALADTFFLVCWMVQFSVRDALSLAGVQQDQSAGWMYMRLYSYPLVFVGQTTTMWITVLIAAVRYIAVCWPYKALQLCQLSSIRRTAWLVTAACLLYNVPRFLEVRLIVIDRNSTFSAYTFERTTMGNSRVYTILYFDILYYCFNFVLPLLLLAFLSIKLTVAYRGLSQRRSSLSSAARHHDPNITLIMIIVVVTFMLCNAPARIVQIIWQYQPQTCLSLEFILMEFSNVLEVLNSSTNFIIYCVFRRQFRQIVQATLCQYRRLSSASGGRDLVPLNGFNHRFSLDATRTMLMSEC